MTGRGETLIETSHLVKLFGDKVAVNDISFDVGAGEIFGFLGPVFLCQFQHVVTSMDYFLGDGGRSLSEPLLGCAGLLSPPLKVLFRKSSADSTPSLTLAIADFAELATGVTVES